MPSMKHPLAALLMSGGPMSGGSGGPPMDGPPPDDMGPPPDDMGPHECSPEQIKAGVEALTASSGQSPEDAVQAIYQAMEQAEMGGGDADGGAEAPPDDADPNVDHGMADTPRFGQ